MKRFFSLLLALLIVPALSTCGGLGNNGRPAKKAAKAVEATTQSPAAGIGEDTPFGRYTETVTISTGTTEYVSAVYPEGDDITNNIWTRTYLDRYNVRLVTDWVTDEYDKKISLAITSGDLPDVVHVNASQLKQLVDEGLIYDLTDIYKNYASTRVRGYMDADIDSFNTAKFDGKLMALPQMHWGIIDQPDYLWIRNDWKEQLGLADPKTMDDVKNICLAFMKAHGGFGITTDKTLDYLYLIAIAWHAYPDMWIKDSSGKILYGSIQPEMKAALQAWAEWYKLGIINPDFAISDFNAMVAANALGKVGVQPCFQWWGYKFGVDVVKNLGKEAIFYPYAIPSADGKPVYQSVFFPNSSYTVVSRNCKNPEAAVKLINFYGYMVDDSTGIESKETISAFLDNDMAHVVGAFRVLNPDCDYDQFEKVDAALKTGDTSAFTTSGMWQKYNNSAVYKKYGTPGTVGDFLQQGADKCAYRLTKQVLDSNMYIKSKLWGATPEVLLSYGTTLDDLLTEGYTKIIMGREPISYFENVVENWYSVGGQAATDAMNQAYGGK